MFEEVPRTRRGLAAYLGVGRLSARRIVLGPFVLGGGMVLAAIGGSVAVAATVFTASTIRAADVPPHPHPAPVVAHSTAVAHPVASRPTSHAFQAPVTSAAPTSTGQVASSPAATGSPSRSAHSAGPVVGTTSASAPATGSPSASAPSSQPSPAGNAIVYVTGWNSQTKQLLFEFASVAKAAGPQQSDVYTIASTRQYTASLAADVHVVSGGLLCPPAGSTCTVDQLIAGTAHGFYAELAIDPTAAVHQVVERDNVVQYAPTQPIPSPTETSPSATAQPTA